MVIKMEFHEKLQELRKKKGITQEALADSIYVSRTAISKWESGRGYPSIDSLKAISRYFSVTIDELICSEEIMIAAKEETDASVRKYGFLISSLLDLFTVLLLVIPIYGNGADSPSTVPLFRVTGIQKWIVWLFFILLLITVLNGICGVIARQLDKPIWSRHRLISGVVMLIICSSVFIITRQPYAGIFCFAILVMKSVLIHNMRLL